MSYLPYFKITYNIVYFISAKIKYNVCPKQKTLLSANNDNTNKSLRYEPVKQLSSERNILLLIRWRRLEQNIYSFYSHFFSGARHQDSSVFQECFITWPGKLFTETQFPYLQDVYSYSFLKDCYRSNLNEIRI